MVLVNWILDIQLLTSSISMSIQINSFAFFYLSLALSVQSFTSYFGHLFSSSRNFTVYSCTVYMLFLGYIDSFCDWSTLSSSIYFIFFIYIYIYIVRLAGGCFALKSLWLRLNRKIFASGLMYCAAMRYYPQFITNWIYIILYVIWYKVIFMLIKLQ